MNLVASDINNQKNTEENVDENLHIMELEENAQIQSYEHEQVEGVNENVCAKNVDENVPIQTQGNVNQQQYLHFDKNQPIQATCTENENICMVCINGHNPTGAHKCDVCKKAVHIIDGCSYNILVTNLKASHPIVREMS